MAERKKAERNGGRYCVTGAPNDQSCKNNSHIPGIRMHQFPTDPVLRGKWTQFVRRHRANFNATSPYTSLCSAHFEESCYERPMHANVELPEGSKLRSFLKKGSIPTRDAVVPPGPEVLSERNRKVPSNILNLFSDTTSIYSYNTSSSSATKFYVKKSRLEIQKKSFLKSRS